MTTNPRRRMIGTVIGNSMTKTVVVRVDRTVRHPLYGKVVHRSQKFLAHDESGCQKGDRVQIVESKPISAPQALGGGNRHRPRPPDPRSGGRGARDRSDRGGQARRPKTGGGE